MLAFTLFVRFVLSDDKRDEIEDAYKKWNESTELSARIWRSFWVFIWILTCLFIIIKLVMNPL